MGSFSELVKLVEVSPLTFCHHAAATLPTLICTPNTPYLPPTQKAYEMNPVVVFAHLLGADITKGMASNLAKVSTPVTAPPAL